MSGCTGIAVELTSPLLLLTGSHRKSTMAGSWLTTSILWHFSFPKHDSAPVWLLAGSDSPLMGENSLEGELVVLFSSAALDGLEFSPGSGPTVSRHSLLSIACSRKLFVAATPLTPGARMAVCHASACRIVCSASNERQFLASVTSDAACSGWLPLQTVLASKEPV